MHPTFPLSYVIDFSNDFFRIFHIQFRVRFWFLLYFKKKTVKLSVKTRWRFDMILLMWSSCLFCTQLIITCFKLTLKLCFFKREKFFLEGSVIAPNIPLSYVTDFSNEKKILYKESIYLQRQLFENIRLFHFNWTYRSCILGSVAIKQVHKASSNRSCTLTAVQGNLKKGKHLENSMK